MRLAYLFTFVYNASSEDHNGLYYHLPSDLLEEATEKKAEKTNQTLHLYHGNEFGDYKNDNFPSEFPSFQLQNNDIALRQDLQDKVPISNNISKDMNIPSITYDEPQTQLSSTQNIETDVSCISMHETRVYDIPLFKFGDKNYKSIQCKGYYLYSMLKTSLFLDIYPLDMNSSYKLDRIVKSDIFRRDLVDYCLKVSKNRRIAPDIYKLQLEFIINFICDLYCINIKEFIYFLSTIIYRTKFFTDKIFNVSQDSQSLYTNTCLDMQRINTLFIIKTKGEIYTNLFMKDFNFSYEEFINFLFIYDKQNFPDTLPFIRAFGLTFRNIYLLYYYYCVND